MSANIRNMINSYNELLDKLRQSIILLEKTAVGYKAEIDWAADTQSKLMDDNQSVFDLFTELIAELIQKLKEVQGEITSLEAQEQLYINARHVFIEILQKDCYHQYIFKGSRDDEDHYVCEFCNKVDVRRAYVLKP